MAGRGAIVGFLTSTSGLIIAIAMQSLALAVWNVGTRGPRELFDDLSAAFRSRRVLGGVVRFVAGALLLLGGALLVIVQLPLPSQGFAPVELIAIAAALLVELLIGPEIRSAMRL